MFYNLLQRCWLPPAFFLFLCHIAPALPVLPNAAGFGTQTPAGRGGAVLRVTTLLDQKTNPPQGTLRWACQQAGARTIIFDVSGIIELKDDLLITNPFVTIAGQTAPAPGIMLRNAPVIVQTHDVLIQHIAVRTGNKVHADFPDLPGMQGRRCITIGNPNAPVSNVVIDHVSASWSVDEIFTIWSDGQPIRDVTIQNCLIAEALWNAGHPEGNHSAGVIIGRNSQRTSFVRNILAHNAWRNPLVRDTTNYAHCVDNLVYRPQFNEKANFYATGSLQGSVKGHVVFLNPDAESADEPWAVRAQALTLNDIVSMFVTDNWVFNPNTGNSGAAYWRPLAGEVPWDLVDESGDGTHTNLATEPSIFLTPTSTSNLPVPRVGTGRVAIQTHLMANAGARPGAGYRDSVDTRIINQINSNTGGLIDNPSQVGGWPAWTAIVRNPGIPLPLNPNADDNSENHVAGNGYTNLEEWLHQLAAVVEGRASTPPPSSVLLDDPFADGSVSGGSGGDAKDTGWTTQNSTTQLSVVTPFASSGNTTSAMLFNSTGTWASAKGGAFASQELGQGKSISLSFDFRAISSSIPANASGLRFGLGSSSATYAFAMGTGTTAGKAINVYPADIVSGTSTALTTSGTALAINNTSAHAFAMTLTRTGATSLQIEVNIDGNAFSATHTGVSNFTFDRVLMGEAGISNLDFHLDNAKVELIQAETVIVQDPFNDGSITGTAGSGDANDIGWAPLSGTTLASYTSPFASSGNTTGALKFDSTGTWASAKGSGGAFNATHALAVNESITLAQDFRVTSSTIPSNVSGLRFGLGSSSATYAFAMGTGTTAGKAINVYAADLVSGTPTALATSGTALAINNTSPHSFELTLTRTATNTLKIDVLIDGNSFSATHTGVTNFTFDRVLMGEAGISNLDFNLDNVEVFFTK